MKVRDVEKREQLIKLLAVQGPLTGYAIMKTSIVSRSYWKVLVKEFGENGEGLIKSVDFIEKSATKRNHKYYWLTFRGMLYALILEVSADKIVENAGKAYGNSPNYAKDSELFYGFVKMGSLPIRWTYELLNPKKIKKKSKLVPSIGSDRLLIELSEEDFSLENLVKFLDENPEYREAVSKILQSISSLTEKEYRQFFT